MFPLIQVLILWLILIKASVISLIGLKKGIANLSLLAMTFGTCLVLIVFMLDNSWFLLNLFVQSTGYYLNWLTELGAHTDAFEQHSSSFGADERLRNMASGQQDGPSNWFQSYTFAYWSWWLTWAPLVGKYF